MISKAIILLLGLIALCYAQPPCELRLWKTGSPGAMEYDGTNNIAPFTGWDGGQQYTFSSLTGGEAHFCGACTLTVYSTNSFGGRSEVYDNMESPYQFLFPFCIKSFTLDCDNEPGNPEEEEEGQEEEEEEQGVYFEPIELTPEVIEIRDYGLAESISRLIGESRIPNNQYELVDSPDNTAEKSVNVNDVYAFNLTVKDAQDKEWIIRFWVLDDPSTARDVILYDGFAK